MRRSDLRILVVDDTAVSRGLITQVLDWLNIASYRTCSDGREAMAALAASPANLVISDYHMPEMDGLSLLERVRRSAGLERTGFILVTGRADPALIARGRALGLNNLINKPFTKEQMRHCIEAVVGPL